jgi:2-keto-4-pentenoate hydratase
MPHALDALIDMIADRTAGRAPWTDILGDAPDLSIEEAYQVQYGLMRRRVAEGDRVVGYKAAYTSRAMQSQRGNGGPICGAILASAVLPEDQPIAMVPDSRNAVEPEVAILLGQDLPGPHVTALDVRRATSALLPAIEVAVGAPGQVERTRHMVIATHKTAGSVIIGGPGRTPDGIDLRTEGAVMAINGETRASATAIEVMGDPYNAAAFIANTVLANGEILRAGMILMTGSIIAAIPIDAGDDVKVDYTRLGSLSIRFAR